jgi:glycosyltransferase involved in cell wall biosynthesis
MRNLTVIICTCNRPVFLREALASIERQSAVQCIDKVIVSENGMTRRSEVICAAFSSFPVEYIYQEQKLLYREHLHWLFGRVTTPYVALLHDDDWWTEDHLSESLLALEEQDCIGVFSNFYEAASTRHPPMTPPRLGECGWHLVVTFPRGYYSLIPSTTFLFRCWMPAITIPLSLGAVQNPRLPLGKSSRSNILTIPTGFFQSFLATLAPLLISPSAAWASVYILIRTAHVQNTRIRGGS